MQKNSSRHTVNTVHSRPSQAIHRAMEPIATNEARLMLHMVETDRNVARQALTDVTGSYAGAKTDTTSVFF